MILTNRTGLPDTLVRVTERVVNGHPAMDDSTFSVTELLKGTKELMLARRHRDELSMDVQQAFSLWSGSAVHALLEAASTDYECLAEKRFSLNLGMWDESLEGCWLSGSPDFYDPKTWTLYDYKDTKVAQYDRASTLADPDWLYQTLAYAHMLRDVGYRVEHITIVAMMKDHSAIKAETTAGYPRFPIQAISYDKYVWDGEMDAEMKGVFTNKVHEVLNMRELGDDEIPPCTPDERFEDEDWALMKPGTKKAFRRFKSKEEAELALEAIGKGGMEVVHRPGDPKKCRLYCPCAPFCSFYKNNVAKREDAI